MSNKIYDACRHLFLADHKLENSFMFDWESDIFLITKSKLTVEIEVKISRSDYFADFSKVRKHNLFKCYKKNYAPYRKNQHANRYAYDDNGKMYYSQYESCEIRFCKPQEKLPNKFYYACPENLIKIDEIPEYAGLIYVNDYGTANVVKKAPQLHKIKHDWTKGLLDKYFWRNLNSKNEISQFEQDLKIIKDKDDQINFLCRLINKVQTILR